MARHSMAVGRWYVTISHFYPCKEIAPVHAVAAAAIGVEQAMMLAGRLMACISVRSIIVWYVDDSGYAVERWMWVSSLISSTWWTREWDWERKEGHEMMLGRAKSTLKEANVHRIATILLRVLGVSDYELDAIAGADPIGGGNAESAGDGVLPEPHGARRA